MSSSPLPHLGAERADAGVAISLHLEDAVGDGRGDLAVLLHKLWVNGEVYEPLRNRPTAVNAVA
jgi:hypothetical protein